MLQCSRPDVHYKSVIIMHLLLGTMYVEAMLENPNQMA